MTRRTQKIVAGCVLALLLGPALWHFITSVDLKYVIGSYQEKPLRLVGVIIGAILIVAVGLAFDRIERWTLTKLNADKPPCCKNCGHELTDNVSGACPECGVRI